MQKDDKGYGRQLLMYALMFRYTYPEFKKFSAGIISMINIDDWVQNVVTRKGETEILSDEILDAFEDELRATIEDLYRDDFYFEHSPESRYCEHCEV